MTVHDLRLMPWDETPGRRDGYYGWSTGDFISLGGAETGPVGKEDVGEVLYHFNSGDNDWDGKEVAVLCLKDGRFVGYETWWGPTGSGFSEDAYGGDANLYFATNLNDLILNALTDEGRRYCGIPEAGLE